MTERLLQFIWQFQYFNTTGLLTTAGETIQIQHPGRNNTNQGPDFADAKVRIGDTTWAGNVELHFKTSDWEKHRHHVDENYQNVILHVVWEDDGGDKSVPVLELRERISKLLLQRYENLMNATAFVPCENSIRSVPDLVWKSWKERLLAERLIRKSKMVEGYLRQSNFHWEETYWWMLARNFGMKVNEDVFEEVARSLPMTILSKHKTQIHRLEALLLGQANLLEGDFKDHYAIMLQKEYEFYKKKYDLRPANGKLFFLRMRPGNFPTIRLAQLAMLVQQSTHLFSKARDIDSVEELKKFFDVTANDYWHYHYRFDEQSSFQKKKPGASMVDSIIINTIAPVLFAYGSYYHEDKYKQKAMDWLECTAAEHNSITRGFQLLHVDSVNAFDSQSLIELKNEYCDKKRCLDCAVGNSLLKSTQNSQKSSGQV